MERLDIIITLLILLLLLVCKLVYYREGYDTREGLFASLVTQQAKSDGTFNRKGVHFQGIPKTDGSGTDIITVDDGVIDVPHLLFLDKFYKQTDEDKRRLKRYASRPKLYPSQDTMIQLSQGKTVDDLQAKLVEARQLSATAIANVDSITREINTTEQSLPPITQSNQELLNNIEELNSQLTIAKQQAQEASINLQTKVNETSNVNESAFLDSMFASAENSTDKTDFSEIPNDLNTLAKDLGIDTSSMPPNPADPLLVKLYGPLLKVGPGSNLSGATHRIYSIDRLLHSRLGAQSVLNHYENAGMGSDMMRNARGELAAYDRQIDIVTRDLQDEWINKFM